MKSFQLGLLSAVLVIGALLFTLPIAGWAHAKGKLTVKPVCGAAGTSVAVTISYFPANTTVTIFLNGARVTTIDTDAGGKGAGSFIVPEGFTTACGGVPGLEVKGSGGGVFGYDFFWRTR